MLDDFIDLSAVATGGDAPGGVRVRGDLAMLKHPQYPRHYMVKMKVCVDRLAVGGGVAADGAAAVAVDKTFALWRTFDDESEGEGSRLESSDSASTCSDSDADVEDESEGGNGGSGDGGETSAMHSKAGGGDVHGGDDTQIHMQS